MACCRQKSRRSESGGGNFKKTETENLKSLWAKVRKLFNSYRDSHLEKGYFYKLTFIKETGRGRYCGL